MKNINTEITSEVEVTEASNLVNIRDFTKGEISKVQKKVNEALISKQLTDLFNVDHGKISNLTQKNINKLSQNNELNSDEIQLAKMFGKYDELIALEDKPKTISLSSVLNHAFPINENEYSNDFNQMAA